MTNISNFKTIEFAYWLGLFHADGSLTKWTKKNDKVQYYLHFENTSEILVKQFQIGLKYFKRFPKYFKRKTVKLFTCKASVNLLLPILSLFNITRPKKLFDPPNWIYENIELFGAYLAGLIDGDGDVRVKRPKYPQCVIRITSKYPQRNLAKLIEERFKCKIQISSVKRKAVLNKRTISSIFSRLEFYVSSKNFGHILKYVIPFIKLSYKREKLLSFIKDRYAVGGI